MSDAPEMPALPAPRPRSADRWAAARRRRPAPEGVKALANIECKLGGREGLLAALSFAPQNDGCDRVLALLGQATYQATARAKPNPAHYQSLADTCAEAGVLPRDVLKWVEEGRRAEAHALARLEAYKDLPATVADVMRKAQPHETLCEECAGRGHMYRLQQDRDAEGEPVGDPRLVPFPCAACGAQGWTAREAVSEDVDRALELGGLVTKAPQVQVNNQQLTMNAGTLHGSLPSLQRAVEQILHGDAFAAEAQEAEVIDADATDDPPADTVQAPPAPPASTPEILL